MRELVVYSSTNRTWNQNHKDEARKARADGIVHLYVTEVESAAQRRIWGFETGSKILA